MGHKDLRLGQIVYILVFYNISFSWFIPLDGFRFNFLLRDSKNDLYGSTTCKFAATIARSMAHALETFYCRGGLGIRVNPDTMGCMWTGEFDLNTLRVNGEIFESGKKRLRMQKYPDTCGRGLSKSVVTCTPECISIVDIMQKLVGG